MPNRTFISWVPCVKRNCRVCFQFLQWIGCRGATQIKSHTFVVSERHNKLRLSYRVSVTASGPSAAWVAEQAVNHDIIVDNVSQKHINESSSLLTKFYFIYIKHIDITKHKLFDFLSWIYSKQNLISTVSCLQTNPIFYFLIKIQTNSYNMIKSMCPSLNNQIIFNRWYFHNP